jgi:hypothetical protein
LDTIEVVDMRQIGTGVLVLAMLGMAVACGPRETPEQRRSEANTPAGKLGQAARKAANEANKASRVISKQLNQAAHDAREGWKEAGRTDGKKN